MVELGTDQLWAVLLSCLPISAIEDFQHVIGWQRMLELLEMLANLHEATDIARRNRFAPVLKIFSALRRPSCSATSGCSRLYVPAEPQQISLLGISSSEIWIVSLSSVGEHDGGQEFLNSP
jgi:hypothetical protein